MKCTCTTVTTTLTTELSVRNTFDNESFFYLLIFVSILTCVDRINSVADTDNIQDSEETICS